MQDGKVDITPVYSEPDRLEVVVKYVHLSKQLVIPRPLYTSKPGSGCRFVKEFIGTQSPFPPSLIFELKATCMAIPRPSHTMYIVSLAQDAAA